MESVNQTTHYTVLTNALNYIR